MIAETEPNGGPKGPKPSGLKGKKKIYIYIYITILYLGPLYQNFGPSPTILH